MRAIVLGLFYECLTIRLLPQDKRVLFSGVVKDTCENTLSYASLRVDETSTGTMSDKNGRFELMLPVGNHKITYSYVGFKSYSCNIQLDSSIQNMTISLIPSEIQLPEVVISGEDPAYPIIREAIQRKMKWRSLIETYKARVYTKDIFGNDTLLTLISEAYSDLYWRKNDSLREIVLYRRQSSNLPEAFQFALVRDFINFNNDFISYWRYKFITPLADSAFQYYEYILRRTFTDVCQKSFEIEVIPRSQILPLFSGVIVIQDSSFGLQHVKLHPNNIFKIPFFEFTNFEFTQQFSLYENNLWFPLDYQINAEFRFKSIFLNSNKILHYSKSVICFGYNINYRFVDSITVLPTLFLLPSANSYDTTQWENVKLFPLTTLERDSYKKIDEIVKEHQFAFQFAKSIQQYKKVTEFIDVQYNRVEGLFLGGKYSESLLSDFRFNITGGYGFSNKKVRYKIGSEILVNPQYSLWFGVENYNQNHTFPVNYKVGELSNSFSSFFNGDDYYNYFFCQGYRVFLSSNKTKYFTAALSVLFENQLSLKKTTDFSLESISSKEKFRTNPSITEGKLASLLIECFTNQESDDDLFNEPKTMWHIRAEHSFPELESSQSFTSLYASTTFRIPTMGTTRLFNPYLEISLSLGGSLGSVPMQRTFALESPLSRFVSASSFRTVKNGEFSGDNFYALLVEHNFRNILFILAGLPSINLDVIIRAATSEMKTKSTSFKNILVSPTKNYNEYTIGIGRIADIFRIDLSYSNYQKSRYAITFTGIL